MSFGGSVQQVWGPTIPFRQAHQADLSEAGHETGAMATAEWILVVWQCILDHFGSHFGSHFSTLDLLGGYDLSRSRGTGQSVDANIEWKKPV